MSEITKKLLSCTSKPQGSPALLVLEDGAVFRGTSCAAEGEVFGEICFNTSLEGYLEVITDPSYAGQIITMTYPQIGNYGVNREDCQSEKPALRGLVVRDMCTTPSNWRSDLSLPDFLRENDVVAIEGVDTRALVRHVRDNGAQRAVLSTLDANVERSRFPLPRRRSTRLWPTIAARSSPFSRTSCARAASLSRCRGTRPPRTCSR